MKHSFHIFILLVGLMTVSCSPKKAPETGYLSPKYVDSITPYVTCPVDTIRMMLMSVDSLCKLTRFSKLECLSLDDEKYVDSLNSLYHREIPSIVQVYASYEAMTTFPTTEANAAFAWHAVAKRQIFNYYEDSYVSDGTIGAFFDHIRDILDVYNCGTQYDLNVAAARSVMIADFYLIDAYKKLLDQCAAPELLTSAHGSYEYVFELFRNRCDEIDGYWSDLPRELACMQIAMMGDKRAQIDDLRARHKNGTISVEGVKKELDARPADTVGWDTLDY